MNLKIDEDYKNLLPELTAEEYTGLERDIVKHGILSPIIVWNGVIVDGHNRYAIAQAHRFPDNAIPTKEISFDGKAQAIEWIINNQKSRRNLTKSQLVAAWSKYEEEVAREAEERKLSTLKQNADSKNFYERNEHIRTAAEVAAKIGVSEPTYRDMKLIKEKGTADQIARMDKGGKGNGVSAIAREIKGKKILETKKCNGCGKVLPIGDFEYANNGYRSVCKKCRSKQRTEQRHESRLEGTEGFYVESVEEKVWSPDEVIAQLERDFGSYLDGLKLELDVHKKEIESHEEAVDKAIDGFVEMLTAAKRVYR